MHPGIRQQKKNPSWPATPPLPIFEATGWISLCSMLRKNKKNKQKKQAILWNCRSQPTTKGPHLETLISADTSLFYMAASLTDSSHFPIHHPKALYYTSWGPHPGAGVLVSLTITSARMCHRCPLMAFQEAAWARMLGRTALAVLYTPVFQASVRRGTPEQRPTPSWGKLDTCVNWTCLWIGSFTPASKSPFSSPHSYFKHYTTSWRLTAKCMLKWMGSIWKRTREYFKTQS